MAKFVKLLHLLDDDKITGKEPAINNEGPYVAVLIEDGKH
ncbi:hypothetical protein ABIB62_004446 [Mucilaginibacter sp. UYP25]